MNWPVMHGWVCPVCYHDWLEWGFTTGQCRCKRCHVEFSMVGRNKRTVTRPICAFDDITIRVIAAYWKTIKIPVSQWTEADWYKAENPERRAAHEQVEMFYEGS